MSQLQQLKRVLEIDRLIRAELYPHPAALAQKFKVSRRMIFHDRQFLLQELHAPLAFNAWARKIIHPHLLVTTVATTYTIARQA